MLSGKNREAAREALSVKVRDASLEWLQVRYESMCMERGQDVDEDIMMNENALRAEWGNIARKKRTQYATCLRYAIYLDLILIFLGL